MKKLLMFLFSTVLVLSLAGNVAAIPISFDVAGAPDNEGEFGSSVTLSNEIEFNSSISADVCSSLDNEIFSLGDGESYTFDFFTLAVDGGILGVGSADIEATLAFEQPPGEATTGQGSGGYITTLWGSISGGYLTWNDMPQTTFLANGDSFAVDFEDIIEGGLGSTTTVSATVTATAAPVPEPSTIMLMGVGLLGLVGYSRKRFLNKAN